MEDRIWSNPIADKEIRKKDPFGSYTHVVRIDTEFMPDSHLEYILRAFSCINNDVPGGCLVFAGRIPPNRIGKNNALFISELIDALGLSRLVFIPGCEKTE